MELPKHGPLTIVMIATLTWAVVAYVLWAIRKGIGPSTLGMPLERRYITYGRTASMGTGLFFIRIPALQFSRRTPRLRSATINPNA